MNVSSNANANVTSDKNQNQSQISLQGVSFVNFINDALLPSAASLNNSIIYLSIFKTSLQVLQYIPSLSCHGLSNHKEASDLTEAVKQTLYEEYLQTYSEDSRD